MNPIFIFLAFVLVAFLNFLIFKLIVRAALKKFIQPYLEDKKLCLIKTEFSGFFSSGDFTFDASEDKYRPSFDGIFGSTFIYVYVKTDSGIDKRYTAKIETVFLRIKKVSLKRGMDGKVKILHKNNN